MRSSPQFPLSLKVSVWLLLNLVLLLAIGIGILVFTGGVQGSSILNGPMGRRLQELTDVIVAEMRAGGSSEWDAVLKRHGANHGVEIALFRMGGQRAAGHAVELPKELRDSVFGSGTFSMPPRNLFDDGRQRGMRPMPPGGNPRGEAERNSPEGPKPQPPFFEDGPPQPPREFFDRRPGNASSTSSANRAPGTGESFREFEKRGPGGMIFLKTLRHTSSPSTWWVILGTPRLSQEPGMRIIMRVPSLFSLARLLDLHIGAIVGVAALALSVLFWLPLVRSITRSLSQLTRATEHFAQGRFDTRVDETRRDEIGRLGKAVNRMAGQLDHLVTGQQRFLSDVAHELNSPIGRMQVAVSILDERVPEELKPAVADVREEVQLMATLVHELLDFSRDQWKARSAVLSDIDLVGVCLSMLDREDPSNRVQMTIPEGTRVHAEPVLIGRAIGNLVRNAIRYAGQEGPITLSARRIGTEVEITVADEGPGVAPEVLPHLGEPFFRGEFARTRESGGAGLGLAIVVRCIRACEGSVQFANRTPKGFIATLRLPGVD